MPSVDSHGRETTRLETDLKVNAATLPRLPVDPAPKNFKVLLVYPNYAMVNLLPTNIGILTSCLRQNGFSVDLFDTTFYRTSEKTLDEIRVEHLQVRKFSLEEFGVRFKPTHYVDDFRRKVTEYQPDLIAVTAVEDTWPQAVTLLESIPDSRVPVIVGGVFPTLAPEVVMKHPRVNILCVGEGEHALVELAYRMWRGEPYQDIRNLWVRQPDGQVVRNPLRPPVPLDDVPHSDWMRFAPERFYRPMQGKIMRMVPIETDRGCPYKCRFCEAPSLVKLYRDATNHYYFRRKPWSRVKEEIELYVAKYDANYIYFNAETFLAMSEQEFDQFIEMYRNIRLPFWMQTRIETITERRIRLLEEVNCNRISIGIEHGNEEFRDKIVGKSFSNKRVLEVFGILNNSSIPITVNNIIGFPGETRELIFDTIELNRHLGTDSVNAYYFTPYRGTPMRELAVQKGYLDPEAQTTSLITGSVLNMPQLSREEILGLVRTFSLYVKFPKEEWPHVQKAEKLDGDGNAVFAELSKLYYERFFDHDFKYTKKACFSTRIYGTPKVVTEDVQAG